LRNETQRAAESLTVESLAEQSKMLAEEIKLLAKQFQTLGG